MEKQLRNITDAYKWSLETAQALREGDFSRIDMDELINEISSLASGLRRELVSLLRDIIEALLIQTYTSEDEKAARNNSIVAQSELQLLLYSSPSLEEALPKAIAQA